MRCAFEVIGRRSLKVSEASLRAAELDGVKLKLPWAAVIEASWLAPLPTGTVAAATRPQGPSSALTAAQRAGSATAFAVPGLIGTPCPPLVAAPRGALTFSGWRGPACTATFRGFAASASANERHRGSSGGQAAVAEIVETDEAARMVLEDPMSRLMASRGMPLGLSLREAQQGTAAAAAGVSSSNSSSSSSGAGGSRADGHDGHEDGEAEEDLSKPPPAEPAYQMEAFSDILRATAAAARRGGGGGGDPEYGSASGEVGGFTAGVQRVGPSLEASWGTTRESPADIARRIVESNLDAERGSGGGAFRRVAGREGSDDDDDDDDDGPEQPLSLSPSEQKYASLEAMSADIKKLDEVFEVLASVPWLDEDVLAEKELKGVAQVGLLGTLEEVGFNIRYQLLRIWSGERGAELAAGPGLEFRDQAALLAILYHTQQIEDRHGPPLGGYLPRPPPPREQEGKGEGFERGSQHGKRE